MPELNLDASNPSTVNMLQRLIGTAMPMYQQHLGVDFGLKQEQPPRPPPPPEPPPQVRGDIYSKGPAPKPGLSGTAKALLIGGGVLGGVLLLRRLRG
jgi:hypothetical protein